MSESNTNPSDSVSNANVKRILSLLRWGDQKINLHGIRDAVLILGNTGSGKSTLTHFLAGNNDDLISTEVGENSGEFIIYDTNNKISLNTTVISKTTVPELIIDHETKTAYIDCPGFNDSRNEAYDIAAAYFIKKVTENVKNIKIVLTSSYPSLRKGVNRTDFLQLLEHVTILIKNIHKYIDGVALIATKVDNNYNVRNNVVSLIPDNSVLQNIAQFLHEVREATKTMKNFDQVYTSEFKKAENKLFVESSQKLLDTLLEKNGTSYSRLSIFRRPDAAGKLSDIKLLQHGRKVIKKMIKNNLHYVPVDVRDIGYAVSDKSKNIIRDLVEEISTNIIIDVARINEILIEEYENLENKMFDDDVYSLREYLKSTSQALAEISSVDESATVEDLVSEMRAKVIVTNTSKLTCQPFLNDMENLGKFLNFLQDVSDKKFDSFAWKWIKQLDGAINYVENSLKWYDFLITLYERLSEYDVQKDFARFHVPKFNSPSGLIESHPDFSNFFDEISNADFLKMVNLKEIQKVKIDPIKVRYFNEVIRSTLTDTLIYAVEGSGQRLEVAGEYIKLSDVISHDNYTNSKSVQIYAKHTIFIDADMAEKNDVSIIAPRWVIVGSRIINLDGSPGANHHIGKGLNGIAGVDDSKLNGQDGVAGKPGESAGHFFGLGDVFEYANNLTVRAIGGTGGLGQEGGDGARGMDGTTPYLSTWQRYFHCQVGEVCTTNLDYRKSALLNLNVQAEVDYTKYGSKGGRGGNAGRGGAGGLGGNPGSITLIGVGDVKQPPVSKTIREGNVGKFGLHGSCGSGGTGGADQKAWFKFGTWSDTKNDVYSSGKAEDGEMGTCIHYSSVYNANAEDRQQPASKEFMYHPSLAITDFRNNLMSNLVSCVKKRQTLKFYEKLQDNEVIRYDNADHILKEFHILNQFHGRVLEMGLVNKLSTPDLAFLSSLLLKRIQENVQIVSNNSQPRQRKLLDFLSLAVNSQLIRFENNKSDSRVVSNRKAYFDLFKIADINQIRHFFLDKANDEIESVKKFVEIIYNDVLDTIERTNIEILKLSQEDLNNDLGDQLLKMKLFYNFKMIVEFLKLSGSLAASDVALVNTLKVTSALPSPQTNLSSVDGNALKESLNTIEEMIGNGIEAIRSTLSKERRALKALGMEYDEICDHMLDLETSLQARKTADARSYTYSANFETPDVIWNAFGANSTLPNEANVKVRDARDRLEQYFKLIRFDANVYLSVMDQEVDVQRLISSIDDLADRSRYIDDTVKELFNVTSPVLDLVKDNLTGDRYKFEELKVFRALVSETLSDVKMQVYKLIDEFKIDEDLQLMIENIDEAVNQMTFIFNNILTGHHDRTLLHNYYRYLRVFEEFGNDEENYLINVVDANALYYEYERFVDIYKKIVSPNNVSNLVEPVMPALGQLPSSYRSAIASNVKQLESNLEQLENDSNSTMVGENFNRSNQNGAFYVWKSQHYEESISKLLRGRTIALKATSSGNSRQYLKFDDIGISFVSNDPAVQRSLDEELKNFNVIMTHTGSSYFSLCSRTELINQDATRFVYNINETSARVDSLDDDGTIEPMLSPYTTWILKLDPANDNVKFSLLLPYRKDGISIELEGHAVYQNETICQKQTPTTDDGALIRKRRDVDSIHTGAEEGILDKSRNLLKSLNPFNYFVDTKVNPLSEYSYNSDALEWNEATNGPVNFSHSFNMTAALTLVDFVVRNITKVKPYQSVERSWSADQARVIAVNILDQFEIMVEKLSREQCDPVQLMGQIENYIMAEKYSKIVDLLTESVSWDRADEEYVRRELIHVVNRNLGSFGVPTMSYGDDNPAHVQGAMIDLVNGSNYQSMDNFNQPLIN